MALNCAYTVPSIDFDEGADSGLHIYLDGEDAKTVRFVRGFDVVEALGRVVIETGKQFERIADRLIGPSDQA